MSALQLIITARLAHAFVEPGKLYSAGGNTLSAGVSDRKKNPAQQFHEPLQRQRSDLVNLIFVRLIKK
jgi:hypothetical protein